VAVGQLGLTGGAQLIFRNLQKPSIQLLLQAKQHKKYAQTTPLDDGVSSLFCVEMIRLKAVAIFHPRVFKLDSDRTLFIVNC
jgi:hypothetical protein